MEKEIHFALGNPLRHLPHLGIHEGRWALGPPPAAPPVYFGDGVAVGVVEVWERVNVHLTLGALRVRRCVEQQFRKRGVVLNSSFENGAKAVWRSRVAR
jgi:hypothetical protein